jgi:hypothetical protein
MPHINPDSRPPAPMPPPASRANRECVHTGKICRNDCGSYSNCPHAPIDAQRDGPPLTQPAAPQATAPNGRKDDTGKPRPTLIVHSMARAMEAVAVVGTDGAKHYDDDNWLKVPNGLARYTDALHRHDNALAQGEQYDPKTGSLHAAHRAWNALATLELILRAEEAASQ